MSFLWSTRALGPARDVHLLLGAGVLHCAVPFSESDTEGCPPSASATCASVKYCFPFALAALLDGFKADLGVSSEDEIDEVDE